MLSSLGLNREWCPATLTPCASWELSRDLDRHLEARCRLVAQELGYGEHLAELLARTPSWTLVILLLSVGAKQDFPVMMLDVKCALWRDVEERILGAVG